MADGYSGGNHIYLHPFGVVPALSEDVVVNIVTALISALTTVGVLVDPTTKGVGDSERAMGYDAPNDDSAG